MVAGVDHQGVVAQAQAVQGARFGLPAFHDLVLGTGGVPLSVLAEVVDTHLVG